MKRILCLVKAIPLFLKCGAWCPHVYKEVSREEVIIISTKANGLDSAIKYIKNFVNENTIIISLINSCSWKPKVSQSCCLPNSPFFREHPSLLYMILLYVSQGTLTSLQNEGHMTQGRHADWSRKNT